MVGILEVVVSTQDLLGLLQSVLALASHKQRSERSIGVTVVVGRVFETELMVDGAGGVVGLDWPGSN